MCPNVDPRDKYPRPPYPKQDQQGQPGVTFKMNPEPVHFDDLPPRCGRLKGMRALITGGDSGIGRAVAVAFAHEGADVAITYLEKEQADADEVAEQVRECGQKFLGLALDLREESACVAAVERTVEELGGLDI